MAVILDDGIARYDDNFQPTGETKFEPWPHVKMKKLVHELHLTIDGPDAVKARSSCFDHAKTVGLIAAVGTAFLGVGIGATAAAWKAASATLIACLGCSLSHR